MLFVGRNTRASVAGALLLATTGLGPFALLHAQSGVTPPRAREAAPPPETPENRVGMAMEGWVKLRYTVLADGTTTDIRAIDQMPAQLSTREAESAVEDWIFDPATADGEPIDWFNGEATIVYDVEEIPSQPSPPFAQAYMGVIDSFNAKAYDDAKSGNTRLAGIASRLSEIGLAATQTAIVDLALEDLHGAYTAIRHATDPDVVTLAPEELGSALNYRYAIELELGRVTDAIETYHRMEELGAAELSDQMAGQVAAIETALEGDGALAIKGFVDREPWMHVPSRRTFTFADIDGDVREIEVECDRRKIVLEFMPDVDWTLPASWGDCTVFVRARRDTTFLFYEFK